MKILFLVLFLLSSSFAQIIVIEEENLRGIAYPKISFRNNKVTVSNDVSADYSFRNDIKVKTYTYEVYLKKQCANREYKIISANFGNKFNDSFVINCLD